jgi:protease I
LACSVSASPAWDWLPGAAHADAAGAVDVRRRSGGPPFFVGARRREAAGGTLRRGVRCPGNIHNPEARMSNETTLAGKTVAILATNGFEQSELTVPRDRLREAGATVTILSPESGEIRGWQGTDWGDSVRVDAALDGASIDSYDALVLPGGQINPDLLRVNATAVDFVRDFFQSGKPLAAICHAPWLLAEADVLRGRRVTSYKSIRTDIANAGAEWVDEPVVIDEGMITSRNPDDLDAFCTRLIEAIREGNHGARGVATEHADFPA